MRRTLSGVVGRLARQFDVYTIISLSMAWVGIGLILSPLQGIGRVMGALFQIDGVGLGVPFVLCAIGIARRPLATTMLLLCLPLYIYIVFGAVYLLLYPNTVGISYLGIYIGYALLIQRVTLRSVSRS